MIYETSKELKKIRQKIIKKADSIKKINLDKNKINI